jgi:hypothetical protein
MDERGPGMTGVAFFSRVRRSVAFPGHDSAAWSLFDFLARAGRFPAEAGLKVR